MADEITRFDPYAYAETIKGKIKGAIVDAIPDAQWDSLVKVEIERLFQSSTEHGFNGQKTVPSEFSKIVRSVFEDELKTRLKAMLASPEWQSRWESNKLVAGEQLGKLLVDNAGQIIAGWLGTAFQNFINSMPRGL